MSLNFAAELQEIKLIFCRQAVLFRTCERERSLQIVIFAVSEGFWLDGTGRREEPPTLYGPAELGFSLKR